MQKFCYVKAQLFSVLPEPYHSPLPTPQQGIHFLLDHTANKNDSR